MIRGCKLMVKLVATCLAACHLLLLLSSLVSGSNVPMGKGIARFITANNFTWTNSFRIFVGSRQLAVCNVRVTIHLSQAQPRNRALLAKLWQLIQYQPPTVDITLLGDYAQSSFQWCPIDDPACKIVYRFTWRPPSGYSFTLQSDLAGSASFHIHNRVSLQ